MTTIELRRLLSVALVCCGLDGWSLPAQAQAPTSEAQPAETGGSPSRPVVSDDVGEHQIGVSRYWYQVRGLKIIVVEHQEAGTQVVATIPFKTHISEVLAKDDRLFVVAERDGLFVVNIRDPVHPGEPKRLLSSVGVIAVLEDAGDVLAELADGTILTYDARSLGLRRTTFAPGADHGPMANLPEQPPVVDQPKGRHPYNRRKALIIAGAIVLPLGFVPIVTGVIVLQQGINAPCHSIGYDGFCLGPVANNVVVGLWGGVLIAFGAAVAIGGGIALYEGMNSPVPQLRANVHRKPSRFELVQLRPYGSATGGGLFAIGRF